MSASVTESIKKNIQLKFYQFLIILFRITLPILCVLCAPTQVSKIRCNSHFPVICRKSHFIQNRKKCPQKNSHKEINIFFSWKRKYMTGLKTSNWILRWKKISSSNSSNPKLMLILYTIYFVVVFRNLRKQSQVEYIPFN